jgi:hypothetical protein
MLMKWWMCLIWFASYLIWLDLVENLITEIITEEKGYYNNKEKDKKYLEYMIQNGWILAAQGILYSVWEIIENYYDINWDELD